MRHFTLALSLMLLLMAAVTVAAAQETPGADKDNAAPKAATGISLKASTGFSAEADYDEHDGGYSVVDADVTAVYDVVSLSYGLRSYDWHDPQALPFGNGQDDPWETLHKLALSLGEQGRFDRRWGWFADLGVSSAYEEEMEDSFGLRGTAGANFALTRTLALLGGVSVGWHPTGWSVLPVAGLLWNQGAEEGFSGRLGLPRTELAYRLDRNWAFRLQGAMRGGVWRLADDSAVRSKGYVKESELNVGAYTDWTPLDNLNVSFGPEYGFLRETTLYDRGGDELGSYDADPAFGGRVSIDWSF